MAPSGKRQIVRHRCLWLYRPRKKATEYYEEDRKAWPRAVLYCWQTGKRVRKGECTACLLARTASSLTYLSSLGHKRPMTSAEWEKRHGKG